MDRFAQLIVAAARQAEQDSGLDVAAEADRVGAAIATGIGGLKSYQDCYDTLRDRGPEVILVEGPAGSGLFGEKAATPAGWKEASPPGSGFKAYFPPADASVSQKMILPRPGATAPTILNYFGWTEDHGLQCEVLVFGFPDAMPAEYIAMLAERVGRRFSCRSMDLI